jgi:stress-induced morphogen
MRRYALGFSTVGRQYSTAMSATPIEDAMRAKITDALDPSTLEIYNDSQLHAHHKAMMGSTSRETHFRLIITSDRFQKKAQLARQRMVYALLSDEMAAEGGIHALQLRTMTPDEEKKHNLRVQQLQEAKAKAAAAAAAAAAEHLGHHDDVSSPTSTASSSDDEEGRR